MSLKFHLNTDNYYMYMDSSENKSSVRTVGDVESGHGRTSNYSAYFNGDTSKAVKVNMKTTTSGDFTWCGWVMKNRDAVNSYPIFMSFGLPYLACNSSSVPFRLSFAHNTTQTNLSGTTIPALNTWYHLCVIQDSTTLKLYVNGVEEASTTSLSDTIGTTFDIGRHLDTDSYRIWGRVDDVRFYDEAITQEQLDKIIDPSLEPVKMSFKSNGDIVAQGFEEDIEWELWNNWVCPALDSSTTQFDSSIGSRTLSSVSSMQADGWTCSLSTIDISNYTRVKGFSQQYDSGSPSGYIEKALPAGYNYVRARFANWYTGTANCKIGGSTVLTLRGGYGKSHVASYYEGTPKIRIDEVGIYWIGEIWVGKKRTEAPKIKNDRLQTSKIKRNSLSINLHPYSNWVVGNGSVGNWTQNGNTAENSRLWQEDPWGQPAIVWRCKPDATSDSDGGWIHEPINIDNTKTYRYSVWVKRNDINVGRFYHGCHGFGSTNGVWPRTGGSISTNPYFYTSITGVPTNQWVLIVGHIWPHGSSTGALNGGTGMYTMDGGKSNTGFQDFVWHSTTTTGRGRNYLYYCTNTSQRQWMVYPRFEICDGTESSIDDMITGKAYINIGKVPEIQDNLSGAQLLDEDSLIITGDTYTK